MKSVGQEREIRWDLLPAYMNPQNHLDQRTFKDQLRDNARAIRNEINHYDSLKYDKKETSAKKSRRR